MTAIRESAEKMKDGFVSCLMPVMQIGIPEPWAEV